MWHMVLLYVAMLLSGLLTGKILNKRKASRGEGQPASIPGLPLLGHALALGRLGTVYIAACQRKFGSVFTLNLAGQRMQFWLEPALIVRLFSAPEADISFKPAVEQFTQRVFGLPSKMFGHKHGQMLQDLRELLSPDSLDVHAAALAAAVEQRLPALLPVDQQVDLVVVVRRLMFGSVVEALFGEQALRPQGQLDLAYEQEMEQVFHIFESGFEMAASPIPHLLQPGWVRSRSQLLTWLRKVEQSGSLQDTTAGELMTRSGLGPDLAPNLLLTVLWAAVANSTPAVFWAVGFLLLPENSHHQKALLCELEGASSTSTDSAGSQGQASLAARAALRALDRRSLAAACTAEAVRLRVHSIDVRMASRSFTVETAEGLQVNVPKGCILAINPFLSHNDPRLYPDAARYDPGRKPMVLSNPGAIVPSVAGLAFGAGPYRCPGRFFAEMEVALVTQLILGHRTLSLSARSTAEKTADMAATPDNIWAGLAGQLLGKERLQWGLGLGLELDGGRGGQKPSTCVPSLPALSQDQDAQAPSLGLGSNVDSDSTGVDVQSQDSKWRSGDPTDQLPEPDWKRQVGFKVPASACMVHVAARGV